jgi:hypothetical protein
MGYPYPCGLGRFNPYPHGLDQVYIDPIQIADCVGWIWFCGLGQLLFTSYSINHGLLQYGGRGNTHHNDYYLLETHTRTMYYHQMRSTNIT